MSKEYRGLRRLYEVVSVLFLWSGALAGLAILNIIDEETRRSFTSVLVAIAFILVTLPLLPFTIIGIGMLMLGDKIDER